MPKTPLIAIITAFAIGAISLMPTMPIFAEKGTLVALGDAPVSIDVLELVLKAGDLPIEHVDDLI